MAKDNRDNMETGENVRLCFSGLSTDFKKILADCAKRFNDVGKKEENSDRKNKLSESFQKVKRNPKKFITALTSIILILVMLYIIIWQYSASRIVSAIYESRNSVSASSSSSLFRIQSISLDRYLSPKNEQDNVLFVSKDLKLEGDGEESTVTFDEEVEETTEEETTAKPKSKSASKKTSLAKKTAETTTKVAAVTFSSTGYYQTSVIPVPDSILFDSNGRPVNYRKVLHGTATAYYGGTMTATGSSVYPGIVAVNPSIIPYGTKMYVVSDDGWVYGYADAQDTGGFIYWSNGPLLDLYMSSYNECVQWGKRSVTVYIF